MVMVAVLSGLLSACAFAEGNVTFRLEVPGRVFLAVYNADDQFVRHLLVGEQLKAGRHTMVWDGLDTAGKAVPPGEWSRQRPPEPCGIGAACDAATS